MMALLLNHLWQSSLCVAGAGLLALALHRNGANVRFWLWFAASVKFLVPFAAVTALGAYLLTPMLPPVAAPAVILMKPLAQPFSAPSLAAPLALPAVPLAAPSVAAPLPAAKPAVPAAARLDWESALLALWAAGFLFIALRWLVRWSRVRALLREATTVQVDAPIAVKFSSSRLEPGLVGILRPVILLPQGIEQQLSQAELRAVLAHELCHWRRRDNLLAAIHMLVEALFWFFPLVWWLGARLNAERERACDESVLADGNDPQMYAEGILKVCRVYLQSPLACVAGVSGAGLKRRIDTIMENRLIPRLNAARKFVLGTSAAAALVLPLTLGLMAVPVAQMQAKAAATLHASADSGLNEPSRNIVPGQGTTPQNQAVAKAETLTPPSPDLSGVSPPENLAMPVVVASNDGRTPNDQPAAPVQPAALAAGPVAAAAATDSSAANAHHPKTEAGVRCLLGLRPDGCETVFENPSLARRAITHCAGQYAGNFDFPGGGDGGSGGGVSGQGDLSGCSDGPLRSVEYLGANAAGGDIYLARFTNKNFTYILPAPGPDGKIAAHCHFAGSPAGATTRGGCLCGTLSCSPTIWQVTSPAGPARILYTRPAEWSAAAVTPMERPAAPAVIVCRPPELVELSKNLGRNLCVQEDILANLNVTGPQIVAALNSPFLRQPFLKDFQDELAAGPDAITCRPRGGRNLTVTCAHNSYWMAMDHPTGPRWSGEPNFPSNLDNAVMPPPGSQFSFPGSSQTLGSQH